MAIITVDDSSVRVKNSFQGSLSHKLSLPLRFTSFQFNEMIILSKAHKLETFESFNSQKLSFNNIQGLGLNFVGCECFLESNSPDILALCEINSIHSGNLYVKGYLSLIQKDSDTHIHSLAI